MLQRINRDQQLNNAIRDRRTGGLDDKHIRLAHILHNLDENVFVGEFHNAAFTLLNAKMLANLLREFWMRRPANDPNIVAHGQSLLID